MAASSSSAASSSAAPNRLFRGASDPNPCGPSGSRSSSSLPGPAGPGADGSASGPDLQDPRVLRHELRRLRRGREVLAMRLRKAQREMGRTRRRQKEAERSFLENEAAVAALSRRLGCAAEGLPEIDEWRELAREHVEREKELRRQLEEDRLEHRRRVEELRQELARGGTPETARSLEAAESRARRRASDEQCMRLQAVRDYLRGDLEGISSEELRELVAAEGEDGTHQAEAIPAVEEYEDVIEAGERQLRERHRRRLRDAVQLSNAALARKDSQLKALAFNVLGRGLEDPKLCTPSERTHLRDLLRDVESLCVWRPEGPVEDDFE